MRRPELPPLIPPPPMGPATESVAPETGVIPLPLTRRQLRQLREGENGRAEASTDPADTPTRSSRSARKDRNDGETTSSAGLGRASALLGAGTMISRLTGFLRSVVLVLAIGSAVGGAGDAFGLANQLPNNVFTLIQTGILTAVIIPQIVRSAAHRDGGQAYISKLFTLGTVVFLIATGIAVVAAPWIVTAYGWDFTAEQRALATAFAYWCLPQIFFYGLYALIGETLNAKRIYGPYTWAPIANNLVSIAGFLLFMLIFGGDSTAVAGWTPGMIALLGGAATAGIVVQAGLLFWAWPRTGLHVRPDFRWRGVGLRDTGRLAGWTFVMVLISQGTGLVQSGIVSAASGDYPAMFLMQNAWLIFMLPYSIFAVSIGTPYFTQISQHAADERHDLVRLDVGHSMRTISLFIVGSTVAIAIVAAPAIRIFTGSSAEAVQSAPVLLFYLVGLLPLSLLFIVQRTFYAYGDTRTPLLFTVAQCVLIVLFGLLAAALAPLSSLASMIALGQSLAALAQVALAIWLLRRKLGGLDLRRTLRSMIRFVIAAAVAGVLGWLVFLGFGGADSWMTSTILLGVLGTALVGGIAFVIYLIVLLLLRAPELAAVGRIVRRVRR